MIKVKVTGNWNKTEDFLKRNKSNSQIIKIMEQYGREGVAALSSATPVDTGKTASSWSYSINKTDTGIELIFNNNNLTKTGIPIAILLQYGHGNGRGAYIRGIDYINPALQSVFNKLAEKAWLEVTK